LRIALYSSWPAESSSQINEKSAHRVRVGLHTMLYLVGLGLADETDITVKGLEVVKRAERVYLEAYTSILLVDKEKLVSRPRRSWACLWR